MGIETRGRRGTGRRRMWRTGGAPAVALAGLAMFVIAGAPAPEPDTTCGETGSASSGSASHVSSPVSSSTFGSTCSGSAVGLDFGSLGSWTVGS